MAFNLRKQAQNNEQIQLLQQQMQIIDQEIAYLSQQQTTIPDQIQTKIEEANERKQAITEMLQVAEVSNMAYASKNKPIKRRERC